MRILLPFALCSLLALSPSLQAQAVSPCVIGLATDQKMNVPGVLRIGGTSKTSVGIVRVPVIFVRFADDTLQTADWPDYRVLPQWAKRFVDSRPDERNRFTPGNLSDLFDRSSGGDGMGSLGLLQIVGEVYYVTTDKPGSYYQSDADVFQHVFAKLDSVVDFSAYDNWAFNVGGYAYEHRYVPRDSSGRGGDGLVDHVFMMWRENSRTHGPGVGGYIPLRCLFRTDDGVVITGTSGSVQFSYNIWGSYEGNRKSVFVPAHEYCHYIFDTGYQGNISAHFDGRALKNELAFNAGNIGWFSLMTANTNGTVSAYERYRAGWLKPRVIEKTTAGIRLEDTHVKNDAILLPVRRDASGNLQEYFLVENIHTTVNSSFANPFLTAQIFDNRIDHGILVYHIENEDPEVPTMSDIDIECADGLWRWGYLEGGMTPADKSDDVIYRKEAAPNSTDAFDERDLIAIKTETLTNYYFALTPSSGPSDLRRRYSRNASIGDNEDLFREGETTVFSPWSNPGTARADGTPSFFALQITGYDKSTRTYTLDVALGNDDALNLSPSRPQNPRIISDSSGSTSLVWQRSEEPDVQRYEILRQIEGIDAEYRPIGLTETTMFQDHVESSNTGAGAHTIHYRLAAIDDQGLRSDASVAVETHDAPPARPEHVAVVVADSADYVLQFHWERNFERDIVGYNIYRAFRDTSFENWALIERRWADTLYSDNSLPFERLSSSVFYKVTAVDRFGQESESSPDLMLTFANAIERPAVPLSSALRQNYPNPFNPETAIEFELASTSRVSLVVYDMLGREVANLFDRDAAAGHYLTRFVGTTLPSGTYVYRLRAVPISDGAAAVVMTKKMTLLK